MSLARAVGRLSHYERPDSIRRYRKGLCQNSEMAGEYFDIGVGHSISANALIQSIERLVGRKARVRYVEQQKGDARETWVDTAKAQRLLSWTPDKPRERSKNIQCVGSKKSVK